MSKKQPTLLSQAKQFLSISLFNIKSNQHKVTHTEIKVIPNNTEVVYLPNVIELNTLIKVLYNLGLTKCYKGKGTHQKYVNEETGQRIHIPTHKKDIHIKALTKYLSEAKISKDDFMKEYNLL